MAEQFNLGLKMTKSDPTSIFLDGPSLTAAIHSRKEVAHDETGELFCFVYQDRLFMESRPYGAYTLTNFKHWRKWRDALEEELRAKGITRYYALVDSLEKFRWCEFLGMRSNLETINDNIEIMVRDI